MPTAKEQKLTKQDKGFVKDLIETGNATKAVIKNYDIKDPNYAGVKGTRLLRKDKIKKAIKTVADSLPDKTLIEVHLEGLNASDRIMKDGEVIAEKPDYAVRHKYLDSAYKIKGYYPKEGNVTAVQVNINKDREEFN